MHYNSNYNYFYILFNNRTGPPNDFKNFDKFSLLYINVKANRKFSQKTASSPLKTRILT
jgi:hypothetical protein